MKNLLHARGFFMHDRKYFVFLPANKIHTGTVEINLYLV